MGRLFKIGLLLILVLAVMLQFNNIKDVLSRIVLPLIGHEDGMHKRKAGLIAFYRKSNEEIKKCNYLLIGDSHTYALKDHLSGRGVVDRGINGETTKGLLIRWDSTIANIEAGTVILQIGYNDFKYRSVEDTYKNYQMLAGKIKAEKIFIVSLFPVDTRRSIINNRIIEFNKLIKAFAGTSEKFVYVDVYPMLTDAKKRGIVSALTYDGVHLNEKGNRLYMNKLNEFVGYNLFKL